MLACVRGGGCDLVEVGPEQVKDEADVTPAKSHRQYGNCQYLSNVQVWALVSGQRRGRRGEITRIIIISALFPCPSINISIGNSHRASV